MDSIIVIKNKETKEAVIPPSFIQKTIVLNLDERLDRLGDVSRELSNLGIEFERFSAIKHDIGWTGYNQSILKILEENQEVENLFLVEDDCKFISDLSHIKKAIKELPNDFDALWLGSNLQAVHTRKYSSHLYELENGWNTHAIVTTKKFRDWCLEYWDKEIVFDEFLRITAQPLKKCFVVYPMVAIQKASFSNIINGFADYEEVFRQAQNKFA